MKKQHTNAATNHVECGIFTTLTRNRQLPLVDTVGYFTTLRHH